MKCAVLFIVFNRPDTTGQVSETLLGQILRYGRRVIGNDTLYGELISRHIFEQADFMPYRARILAERRMAWIGK